MSDERIELDVTLVDKASTGLHDIADEAAKVEKLSPEVAVTADTSKADADLKDVEKTTTRLESSDTVITLRAQIDDAKAQLKEIANRTDDVGEHADQANRRLDKMGGEGGLKTRGNAIADLTGPLGDASSAASDFAGVMDGIGSIAGDVAGKVGLSAAAMESAIGGIGIAIAAAAAIWTLFTGAQDKAKQKQKDLIKGAQDFNKLLAEGDVAGFGKKLAESYGNAYNAAKNLGISVDETTGLILGQKLSYQQLFDLLTAKGIPAQAGLINQLLLANNAYNDGNDGLKTANTLTSDVTESVKKLTAANTGLTSATQNVDRSQRDFQDQIDATKQAIDDHRAAYEKLMGRYDKREEFLTAEGNFATLQQTIKDGTATTAEFEQQVLTAKQGVLDYVESFKGLPDDVKTRLEVGIDQGSVDHANAVLKALEVARTTPLFIEPHLRSGTGNIRLGPDGSLVVSGTSASSPGVVNVNLPRGYRGDVVSQVAGNTRRVGTRYGAPVVRYARR